VVFASRAARGRLGAHVAIVLALLASQIVLGALSVWKLLHFSVVTLHLGNALLFFAALLALAERARALAAGEVELEGKPNIAPAREEQNVYGGPGSARGGVRGLSEGTERSSDAGRRSRPAGSSSDVAGADRPATRGWFAVAATATFAQILLGGLVSTNHAGLACPDFPGCHGRLFPPLEGLVGLQMTHRFGAYALALLLGAVAWRARGATDVRIAAAAQAALALTGLQILLGVLNVWLTVPVWLSAAHLATATALFALLVLASLRS
jgi:heme A synthase